MCADAGAFAPPAEGPSSSSAARYQRGAIASLTRGVRPARVCRCQKGSAGGVRRNDTPFLDLPSTEHARDARATAIDLFSKALLATAAGPPWCPRGAQRAGAVGGERTPPARGG